MIMTTLRARADTGFTMIEILVAVCVVAILIALAGPFLTNMGAAQQVRSAGRQWRYNSRLHGSGHTSPQMTGFLGEVVA